jgi:hypothetical protein
MRLRVLFGGFVMSLLLSLAVRSRPVMAQIAEPQVRALVEALRQAAPQTGVEDDGLYSQWQIKPDNISRWSRSCIGEELTPSQFSADNQTARTILVCVMEDVLADAYTASNSEAIAVRRAASWWMTGDPSQYNSGTTADYTQRVLTFYEQQLESPTTTQPTQPEPTATEPTTPAQPAAPRSTVYDRYMRAGYAATDAGDYGIAQLYFQRALDERPNDSYAQQALRNVQDYQQEEAATAEPDVEPDSESSVAEDVEEADESTESPE